VPYFDRTHLTELSPGPPWHLLGEREGEPIEIVASFVIDATGFDGALPRALGIETGPEGMMLTRSWSVYSHFTGVERWADVQKALGADLSAHPFSCDDAALHHVLPDGWVWVLRFDNGVTSAGVLFDPRLRPPDLGITPAAQWDAVLLQCPSLARQFRNARSVLEWRRTGVIQRRARQVVGPNWALISSAAYSLDALFSTGNTHALLTVQRLARLIERHSGKPTLARELTRYERAMQREIDFLDHLVHGSYQSFRCFPLLAAWTMYYFTGAIASEHRRREGSRSGEEDEILFSDEPLFRERVMQAYQRITRLVGSGKPSVEEVRAFERQVARDIAPWNVAGLCDPAKLNLYPFA
jgi:FADH2 O2-dependent halogenase